MANLTPNLHNMEKFTRIYTERRTCLKYDEGNVIGYLNEVVIPEFVPEYEGTEDAAPTPTVGYSYTGTERDGGTIMPCSDPKDYGQLTNAIIRASLSESDELAIQRHYNNDPVEYADEWHKYNELCENAKLQAKMWLNIE